MKDYFSYLPDRSAGSLWGCVATSVGFARIPPGSPYPPPRHPVDHQFTWSRGRVLQGYQMVLISQGAGVFESEVAPRQHRVQAGTLMLLFPGVWHRYRPDPATGWSEHWLECRGRVFIEARRTGLIQPERAVLPAGTHPDLLMCFERGHSLARRGALNSQDALSTLGLHLLSLVIQLQREQRGFTRVIDEVVERGHDLITARCHEPLNLRRLARELGVSGSHFRQAFKSRLGLSPKQYQLQVRLDKAKELLSNTGKSIKEISEILGFESAFHLSKQFKARLGEPPRSWRLQFGRTGGVGPSPCVPTVPIS